MMRREMIQSSYKMRTTKDQNQGTGILTLWIGAFKCVNSPDFLLEAKDCALESEPQCGAVTGSLSLTDGYSPASSFPIPLEPLRTLLLYSFTFTLLVLYQFYTTLFVTVLFISHLLYTRCLPAFPRRLE